MPEGHPPSFCCGPRKPPHGIGAVDHAPASGAKARLAVLRPGTGRGPIAWTRFRAVARISLCPDNRERAELRAFLQNRPHDGMMQRR